MKCPVCAAKSLSIIHTRNGFTIDRCSGCELVFASPIPSSAELATFYSGFQYAKPDDGAFAAQAAHAQRGIRKVFSTTLRDQKPRKALDFGGGLGFYAAALSEIVPDVALYDLDDKAMDYALERFGKSVRVIRSAEQALAEQYDLILCNQVIEHVPDPVAFMAQFLKALAPGGLLVVTTPNNNTNDALFRPDIAWHYAGLPTSGRKAGLKRLTNHSWLCCDPPRHLYAFNPHSLNLVMRQAGFSAKTTDTAYWNDDPFGQPKYRAAVPNSFKSAAWLLLYLMTSFTGIFAKISDPKRERGTTLIGCFSNSAEGRSTT